ncbi:MAG: chromosome segregation protein SMC [Oligoflexia bacterium]|nr:chromosome segregation protein SMC [Oligoflexia bacterium]
MRVKRLEIQGFKSFKDKTIIHFDHGITGIVGPNGCGKSNIVDAFFWVMGEQSYKHMRGNGSDDLIFNGSSRYSPLGMAEATLVLETEVPDTEDGPAGATVQDVPAPLRTREISVTRRLYRGGEGEYFVNGVSARLKDIQELFMDTGVGAKGYSVIEQGQIGKIVNAKPEERRLLIEEAAGIAKYKARKKESLRKVEATEANLARLTDVIQEIERNVGSLERQAQKARQYKKYKDELLDKEMTWGRRKIQVLRQKLEALRKQKEALDQELVGLRAELQVAENTIEIERVEQVTDAKDAEELQNKVQVLSDSLTREKSELDLSRRRRSDLHQQLEALDAEKSELLVSIETERARLAERETENSESESVYSQAAAQACEMDDRVHGVRAEAETLRRELDAAKRELMAGIQNSANLNSRAASLLGRAESAQAQILRVEQQIEDQNEKIRSTTEELSVARSSMEEKKIRLETLKTEKKTRETSLREQEQNLRRLERERDESLRALTQLKSRLQSLEELSAAHEGFGDGPRAALEWAREHGKQGEFFSLAEALEVTPGYESALEGWLENRLESLISLTGDAALQAINQVRSDRQGRVAIQALDATISRSDEAAPLSAQAVTSALRDAGFEVLGELSSLVKINGSIEAGARKRAAETISRVLVVQDLAPLSGFLANNGASRIAQWSLVSMDGSALGADGTLRGGNVAVDGGASLVRRKNMISEIAAQVATSESKHAETESVVVEARTGIETHRAALQALSAELQTIEVESAALERDVHQMDRAFREDERRMSEFGCELERLREEAERAALERSAIEDDLASFTHARAQLEARIEAGEKASSMKLEELRALEEELSALKVAEAQVRERSSSLARELEAGRALIRDRERRLNEINRTTERASGEREQFSGDESGSLAKIETLSIELANTKDRLSAVRDRIEQTSAKTSATLERIKALHKNGDQKNSESSQLALELEKVSMEADHLVQNLEEKYGPGCLEKPVTSPIQEEMTEPVVTAEMSAEEEAALGEDVERLRDRIRRLGEVNMSSIEEFEEAKKRHDYLQTEKQDLEVSIENLNEAIEHINRTSEERFRKAFEAIADRFERLFPIIFGGGQAKLSLVYAEGVTDILEAGVDILAQPPGKKIVNIGLLSGGEKALTACSLIFAIFLVKPSPFCVLDEVDAPLDDANIGKFNALLREMSVKSQFILITHNKKTMELNDTLYGVTMEEPGVSKMVSIELH